MTLPPETFSTPQNVLWRDRGLSRMTLESRGKFVAPSGLVELGDAAREEFVHELSITLALPTQAAEVELAVVTWDDGGPVPSRVAAVTLWWRAAGSQVSWTRVAQSVPVDSAVGLIVDASATDSAMQQLSPAERWTSVMSSISDSGVCRVGEALLFDCGTAAADFPVWTGVDEEGQVVGLRISTMLLDESELARRS